MKRRILHNDRGETLVEVLASILIVTLSLMLLAGSVMVSSRGDSRAEKLDKAHYNALSGADTHTGTTPVPETVTISTPSATVTPGIEIYGGEGMYSYARAGS